jgi:hypothetical protein
LNAFQSRTNQFDRIPPGKAFCAYGSKSSEIGTTAFTAGRPTDPRNSAVLPS